MLNSRDISLLRADVAANCRKFIELAKADGWPVLVTATVRDEEYQRSCYEKGTSNTPYPSFHSVKAGLAFDVCKNVKGQEYSDSAFWAYCGALGKKMGFEWGGDWKSIVDKPHFQWSDGGKYTSSMIRAGKYPRDMPLYETEDEMSEIIERIAKKAGTTADKVEDALVEYVRYANLKEDDWEDKAVKALRDAGIITADRPGNAPVTWGEFATVVGRINK